MSGHDASPALVTGGSKGIGAATCVALARRATRSRSATASDEAGAQRTVAAIEAAGGKALAVRADVADASRGRPVCSAKRKPRSARRARAREQRRRHARRARRAHDRRAVGRGPVDEPHRRVPHDPPCDAGHDEGALRAHRQRVVGERAHRRSRARRTTPPRRPACSGSPVRSPASSPAAASPATSSRPAPSRPR